MYRHVHVFVYSHVTELKSPALLFPPTQAGDPGKTVANTVSSQRPEDRGTGSINLRVRARREELRYSDSVRQESRD